MIHHVQLACPPDSEAASREFYGAVLGLAEIPKPPALARRGGCWFRGLGHRVAPRGRTGFPARPQGPSWGCWLADLEQGGAVARGRRSWSASMTSSPGCAASTKPGRAREPARIPGAGRRGS